MSVNINADTTNGLVLTSDTSGELKLQSAGVDIATVSSTGIAMASGKGLAATGHVLQVVQSVYTSSTSIASTSLTDVGHNLTITPTSTSSKILIRYSFNWGQVRSSTHDQDHLKRFTIYRDSTNLAPANTYWFQHQNEVGTATNFAAQTQESTIEYLDSPNTTSAITYKLYATCDSSTITILYNRRGASANLGVCTATAMEIAG
jgi:hypothetical protein